MPLVGEVWSSSTGPQDLETKLQGYQLRGDTEIRLLHPYDRTLTTFRKQPDGNYSRDVFRSGATTPVALPAVRIDVGGLVE